MKIKVQSGLGLTGRRCIDSMALQAVHAIWNGNALLLRDGWLIEMSVRVGDDAVPVRECRVEFAAA